MTSKQMHWQRMLTGGEACVCVPCPATASGGGKKGNERRVALPRAHTRHTMQPTGRPAARFKLQAGKKAPKARQSPGLGYH